MELPARISLNSLIFFIENYCCPVKKENIFMLRFENSLLCKQNGITSQIVYYHFEDRVLYFKGGSLVADLRAAGGGCEVCQNALW